MKTFLKVLAALTAIAGVVYVVATYGDRIVAWAKNLVNQFGCHEFCYCDDCCCDEEDCCCEEAAQEADFEA